MPSYLGIVHRIHQTICVVCPRKGCKKCDFWCPSTNEGVGSCPTHCFFERSVLLKNHLQLFKVLEPSHLLNILTHLLQISEQSKFTNVLSAKNFDSISRHYLKSSLLTFQKNWCVQWGQRRKDRELSSKRWDLRKMASLTSDWDQQEIVQIPHKDCRFCIVWRTIVF